jgi:hypothetical protein
MTNAKEKTMHALQLVMDKSAIPTSSRELLAGQQGGAIVVFLQQGQISQTT